MLEVVVEEIRSLLVEEKGVKEEEMARLVGTCTGHTEPGRRVGAQVHPALLHPWANPIQRDKRENDKKKQAQKHEVKTRLSRFFCLRFLWLCWDAKPC